MFAIIASALLAVPPQYTLTASAPPQYTLPVERPAIIVTQPVCRIVLVNGRWVQVCPK